MEIRTGDPELAREINEALVLNLLRSREMISRADITRALNLSKVTVSAVVSELIGEGLVKEIGEGNSLPSGGRKPRLLSLNTDQKYVIGIDVGKTSIVCAMSNLRGDLLTETRTPTARESDVENIVGQVESVVEEVTRRSGAAKDRILGIDLSVAGIVDRKTGFIRFSPDFGWQSVPIAELLSHRSGFTVEADNCTRVMALGEKWYGVARGVANVFSVNIGYGIGSAFIINGQICNSNREFGHLFITKTPVTCDCGKEGCLEAVASGHAIERTANEQKKSADWITASMLEKMARQGDVQSLAIYESAGKYLGRAISIIANVFNPDKVILGGGVALAGDLLLGPIRQEYDSHTMEAIKSSTEIEVSALGLNAGVYGAVAVALNRFVFKPEVINT